MSEPMTEAEQAAAEALARHFNLNYSDGIERHGAANWGPEARAVVAAVRPLIEHEAAGKALLAAASDIETVIDAATITNHGNFSGAISGLERAKSIIHNRAERSAKAHLAAIRTTTSEETR